LDTNYDSDEIEENMRRCGYADGYDADLIGDENVSFFSLLFP